jgi:predicted transcriptional regulator
MNNLWSSPFCRPGVPSYHTIIGLPWVRHHLSERMRLAALRHTEMAEELAALQAAVSTIVESVLGRSTSDTFCVEVVSKLATEF